MLAIKSVWPNCSVSFSGYRRLTIQNHIAPSSTIMFCIICKTTRPQPIRCKGGDLVDITGIKKGDAVRRKQGLEQLNAENLIREQ